MGRIMKRWWLVILLLLSVGINLGVLLTLAAGKLGRQSPARPSLSLEQELAGLESRVEPFVVRMADELGVEGEIRRQFADHQRRFFEQTARARRSYRQVQQQLVREIGGPAPDRQRVDLLLDELAQAYAVQERAFVDNLLDTREILEPAQWRKFSRYLRRVRQATQAGAKNPERRFRQQLQERQRRLAEPRDP